MKQDRLSSFSPAAVSWLVALILCGFALGACTSSGSRGGKQRRIQDCVAADNSYSVCKSWIGE